MVFHQAGPPRFHRSLQAAGTGRRRAVSRSGCARVHLARAAMMTFSSLGEAKVFAARKLARGVDRSARIVLIAPAPDGVEVLQPKSDRVENLVAVGANAIHAVQLCALSQGQILDRLSRLLLVQRWNVRRREAARVRPALVRAPTRRVLRRWCGSEKTSSARMPGMPEDDRRDSHPLSFTRRISGPVTDFSRPYSVARVPLRKGVVARSRNSRRCDSRARCCQKTAAPRPYMAARISASSSAGTWRCRRSCLSSSPRARATAHQIHQTTRAIEDRRAGASPAP